MISIVSGRTGGDISTNVSGDVAVTDGVLRFVGFLFESCHFHHDSAFGLIPTSVANSAALSPLSFHGSTRFAHVSRFARSMASGCT